MPWKTIEGYEDKAHNIIDTYFTRVDDILPALNYL